MTKFDIVDNFLSESCVDDNVKRSCPKLGTWRVELIKHNRTRLYTLRFGFSGYNAAEVRYYIRTKRLYIGGITEAYIEGDTFSILNIPFSSEEEAQNYCYDVADRYRNDQLFVLPRSHSNFYKDLSPALKEVIDGALAGDGCITQSSSKSAMFLYQLGEKQLGHMEELLSVLQQHGYDGYIKKYVNRSNMTGRDHNFYSLTWTLRCLKKHKERWYSPSGEKKLPDDVSNTPTFWRWFYAGDGCFERSGAFNGHVTLCANDFSTEDVERLRAMLAEHNIESRKWQMTTPNAIKSPQWLIWMFSDNARRFLEMTSPAVKGLEYKWAIPKIPTYTCSFCLKDFKPFRVDMKYCSSKCRERGKPSRMKKE